MFKRLPGIGMAVGPEKISAVWLTKNRDGLIVECYGMIDIPPDTINAGNISSIPKLTGTIKTLADRLNLKGKAIAVAFSSPHVYMRSIKVPKLKLREMKAAAFYKASLFLPVPIEDTIMDVSPLRYFEDKGKQWCELFFVAVPRQPIQDLKQACDYAGIRVKIVDIEHLCLIRALGENIPNVAILYLTIGRASFTAYCGMLPVFHRNIHFANIGSIYVEDTGCLLPPNRNDVNSGSLYIPKLVEELILAIEYYNIQALTSETTVDNIVLCGRGDLASIKAEIEQQTAINVQLLDISKLLNDQSLSDEKINVLREDYPVALGLAVRRLFK